MVSQVLPMWTGARSRARAFEWQGVTLKFPARSRSGVRAGDGMVVFALPAAQVRNDDWGCSCVLWTPARGRARQSVDPAVHQEMLRHCRIALIKAAEDYWAKWGSVARARSTRQLALAREARL